MLNKKTKKVPAEVDMSFDLTPTKDEALPKKKKKAPVHTPVVEIKPIAVKKKKKEPGTALAIPELRIDDPLPKTKRISKLKLADNLTSILGDDAESLQQLLETGDSDSALTLLNKRLIQTSVDLIAEVESGIRESKGRYGVHSFNGLVQSIRELMIDLQATKDRGAMGVTLVDNVLRPAFLDIATAIMQEYATVANEVKDLMGPDVYKQFRQGQIDSRNRLAALMQTQYLKIRDETVQFLQR
jgi:hypothetical protein